MKKIFTLLFIVTCLFSKAQTLHKQYSLNYCNSNDCDLRTLTYGGGLYFCYIEDSTAMGGSKQNMVLQKNDLNGNMLWKKCYKLTYPSYMQTTKLVSIGANIFVGGTYGVGGFLTSLDTVNGSVNYFNYYPPYGAYSQIQIKDIAVLNNEIVAVGNAQGSTLGVYMYLLRANATTGATIMSGTNFYNDQRPMGVACLNNAIYIVGTNTSYPFISKLRINGSGYTHVATRMYTSGFTVVSTFEKILCNNSTMVVMGSANNSPSKNFLVKIDTNITSTVSALIAKQAIGTSTQLHNMVLDGNNTLVSGYFGSMLGVARFDSNLNLLASNTYSTFGTQTQIQYHNNYTYFTASQGNTFSNITLVKGSTVGITACSIGQNPPFNMLTTTNTVLTTSLTITNTVTALSPIPFNSNISYTTTCLTTDVKVIASSEAPTKLLSGANQFEVVSETYDINEVSVFDLTGKLISRATNLQQSNFKVDLNPQSKGLYFIQIKLDNDQSKTFKVVNQ
ncbi:MAG: T9SS type A sorting domain-containing protein [Bacteroidia bacterium]|nr:T9SS type A sorting domain-containing protein [Bacteroidia bacterium]